MNKHTLRFIWGIIMFFNGVILILCFCKHIDNIKVIDVVDLVLGFASSLVGSNYIDKSIN